MGAEPETAAEPAGSILRVPPHSLDAEAATLGAILLDPPAVARVVEILQPEDFYRSAHARLFEVLKAMFAAGTPCEPLLVAREIERRGLSDEVPPSSLASLPDRVQSSANVEHYAAVVREKAIARGLIRASMEIQRAAFAEEGRGDDLLDRARHLLHEMDARAASSGLTMAEAIEEAMGDLDPTLDRRSCGTGYASLDEVLGPMEPGSLNILAARTSMGKTALALNIATRVCHEKPVLFFSMEMKKRQIARRALSMFSGVGLFRLKPGTLLSDGEHESIRRAIPEVRDLAIRIDDRSSPSVERVRAVVKREASRRGVGLVVVDYLHLMRPPESRTIRNRENEVGEISRGLKRVAMDCDLPVLALAQLNREPARENRTHTSAATVKPPTLTDLRDSGSLEQDASTVMLLHRPGYYTKRLEDARRAEVHVAKNRDGTTGVVPLEWDGRVQMFTDAPTGGL